MTLRRSSFAVLACSLALLGGCGITGACTLIGCESGLFVQITGTPAGAYRVEAIGAGSEVLHFVNCPSAEACAGGAVFRDFFPESVTIRVTTAAGTTTQSVQPTYTDSQPNGPNCPPTCRQGSVTVALPG
jgi:hypothetical protein